LAKELIALAKASPGKLNYNSGQGSPNHLAMELTHDRHQRTRAARAPRPALPI
jgi:hypothetical protein